MKTITLLIASFLFLSIAKAQVEIREYSGSQPVGNDISGTTFTKTVLVGDHAEIFFDIKNVSGSVKSLKVNRIRIVEEPLWWDYITWSPNPDPNFEGMCYSAGSMNSTSWSSNSVNVESNSSGLLQIYIGAESQGSGLYRYVIMEDTEKIDSIDVQINTSSLNVSNEEVSSVLMYPNPVNEELTIIASGIEEGELRMIDLSGKVVYTGKMNSLKKLDVSQFENGTYFIELLRDNEILQTRKIVVNHL